MNDSKKDSTDLQQCSYVDQNDLRNEMRPSRYRNRTRPYDRPSINKGNVSINQISDININDLNEVTTGTIDEIFSIWPSSANNKSTMQIASPTDTMLFAKTTVPNYSSTNSRGVGNAIFDGSVNDSDGSIDEDSDDIAENTDEVIEDSDEDTEVNEDSDENQVNEDSDEDTEVNEDSDENQVNGDFNEDQVSDFAYDSHENGLDGLHDSLTSSFEFTAEGLNLDEDSLNYTVEEDSEEDFEENSTGEEDFNDSFDGYYQDTDDHHSYVGDHFDFHGFFTRLHHNLIETILGNFDGNFNHDSDDIDSSRRMSMQEINTLPLITFSNSSQNSRMTQYLGKRCQICLSDYQQVDRLRTLPCFHCFHQKCIDQWLLMKNKCPMCRKTV